MRLKTSGQFFFSVLKFLSAWCLLFVDWFCLPVEIVVAIGLRGCLSWKPVEQVHRPEPGAFPLAFQPAAGAAQLKRSGICQSQLSNITLFLSHQVNFYFKFPLWRSFGFLLPPPSEFISVFFAPFQKRKWISVTNINAWRLLIISFCKMLIIKLHFTKLSMMFTFFLSLKVCLSRDSNTFR